MIKLFLADDHQLFLEGIQTVLMNMDDAMLSNEKPQITSANNGLDALTALREGEFDIALIDLRLPKLDGFGLLQALSKINCFTPVIIVTASEDPQDIQQAFELGAMGFIPKSFSGQQIITAIKGVLKGELIKPDSDCFTIEVNAKGKTNKAYKEKNTKADWAEQHHITPRQLEVLRLIRHGLSNQAIANKLCLSTATVKTHIVALFQTLGTQSRTETIRKAQQLGLD